MNILKNKQKIRIGSLIIGKNKIGKTLKNTFKIIQENMLTDLLKFLTRKPAHQSQNQKINSLVDGMTQVTKMNLQKSTKEKQIIIWMSLKKEKSSLIQRKKNEQNTIIIKNGENGEKIQMIYIQLLNKLEQNAHLCPSLKKKKYGNIKVMHQK